MVLDYDGIACDASRLSEENLGMLCMMKHVDEEHEVECAVGKGQRRPGEALDGNAAVPTNQDVHTLYLRSGSTSLYALREHSVTTSDIEDRGAGRDQRRNGARERPNTSLLYHALVKEFERLHGASAKECAYDQCDTTRIHGGHGGEGGRDWSKYPENSPVLRQVVFYGVQRYGKRRKRVPCELDPRPER